MLRKFKPLFLVTLSLILATLACRFIGRSEPELGETFRIEEGGFSLRSVPNYHFDEFSGMVIMTAEDADPDIGPFIMLHGGWIEINKSAQDLLDEIQADAGELQFARASKSNVDGIEGLLTEFSGEYEGKTVKGKLFVVPPLPQQEFYAIAMAPESHWKELEPLFDAVLKSVQFFEAPQEIGFDDWDAFDDEEEIAPVPIEEEELVGYLGEPYTHPEAGFSLRKVEGYDFSDDFGIIQMAEPNLESYAGPLIILGSDLMDEPVTNEELLAMAQEDPNEAGITFHTPLTYVLDGVNGLLVDFDGMLDGEAVRGQVFMAMVTPNRYFFARAVAPEAKWDGLLPRFTALLGSIEITEAESVTEPDLPQEVIRQWAIYAEASTEYTDTDWSAMQATGAPDVDGCGDDPQAWASRYSNTRDHLRLEYETPVNPTELVIYQTYNPSQVVEILFEDVDGDVWVLWEGVPERVECPDTWVHTIELYEVFYTDTVILIIDQSLNDWGWAEIDAVELVGYPIGATVTQPDPPAQPPEQPITDNGDIPTNYDGLMAGPIYQGWVNIVIGETMEEDLDRIMTIEGRKSTDSWKPRESHAQTYLFTMPWEGMTGYISVTTDGWVYKKNVTSNTHPTDFALATVNREVYEELKAIYDQDKVIPYAVMAKRLGSPGFLREQYIREDDGVIVATYNWYNADGDRMTGIFFNGRLTGMMGLNYIEAP